MVFFNSSGPVFEDQLMSRDISDISNYKNGTGSISAHSCYVKKKSVAQPYIFMHKYHATPPKKI